MLLFSAIHPRTHPPLVAPAPSASRPGSISFRKSPPFPLTRPSLGTGLLTWEARASLASRYPKFWVPFCCHPWIVFADHSFWHQRPHPPPVGSLSLNLLPIYQPQVALWRLLFARNPPGKWFFLIRHGRAGSPTRPSPFFLFHSRSAVRAISCES